MIVRVVAGHRPSVDSTFCVSWFGALLFAILFLQAFSTTGALLVVAKNSNNNNGNGGRPMLSSQSHAILDATLNGILIQDTKTKGLGAFTGEKTTFQAGAWIGEYKGELLTRLEVETRYWNYCDDDDFGNKKKKTKNNKVGDRRWLKSRKQRKQGLSGDYLFDMGDDLFLDAEDADISSWCRFMNHAPEILTSTTSSSTCEGHQEQDNPECNVETKWSPLSTIIDDKSGKKTIIEPRLWFIARRDIKSGEELLYDYGDSYWNEDDDDDKNSTGL